MGLGVRRRPARRGGDVHGEATGRNEARLAYRRAGVLDVGGLVAGDGGVPHDGLALVNQLQVEFALEL